MDKCEHYTQCEEHRVEQSSLRASLHGFDGRVAGGGVLFAFGVLLLFLDGMFDPDFPKTLLIIVELLHGRPTFLGKN